MTTKRGSVFGGGVILEGLPIFLGGLFVYHVTAYDGASAFFLGGDVGYDFQISGASIRPELGLGIGHASVSASIDTPYGSASGSVSDTEIVIAPGLAGTYELGNFFVGADLRFWLILDDGDDPFGFYAFAGAHL